MKKIIVAFGIFFAIFSTTLVIAKPANAQFSKPTGAPITTVPGNINISVFATLKLIDLTYFVGVFEQHADSQWYWTGLGMEPKEEGPLNIAIASAGGVDPYLKNVVLPALNTDIQNVYYGGTTAPPPPGAPVLDQLNFGLVTGFIFKTVNGVQVLSPR